MTITTQHGTTKKYLTLKLKSELLHHKTQPLNSDELLCFYQLYPGEIPKINSNHMLKNSSYLEDIHVKYSYT